MQYGTVLIACDQRSHTKVNRHFVKLQAENEKLIHMKSLEPNWGQRWGQRLHIKVKGHVKLKCMCGLVEKCRTRHLTINVVSSSPVTVSIFVSLGKILNLNLLHWAEHIWDLLVVGNIHSQVLIHTQQNSSCSHWAVTGQWRCGDYPLTY